MRVFSIKIQSKNIHKYFCLIWKYSIVWTLPCVVPVFMCSAVFQCDNNYSFIITINVTDIQKPPTWFCCTLHRCFFKFFFEICSVWGVEASDRLAGDILDQSERSKIKTRGSAWEHDAIAHSMQQSGQKGCKLISMLVGWQTIIYVVWSHRSCWFWYKLRTQRK